MSEETALAAIESTYGELDGWAARLRSVETPQRGSDLDRIDRAYPPLPISQVVRMSLAGAVDHLEAARQLLIAKTLHPYAHFALMRGTLLGSAQAVWICAPDEADVRLQHGLTVIAEMNRRMLQYARHEQQLPLDAAETQRLTGHIASLESDRADLTTQRTTSGHLHATTMIEDAIGSTFAGDDAHRVGQRHQAMTLWMQLSGDAHVLGWSTLQRGSFTPGPNPNRAGTAASAGSLEKMANPWMCVYRLLRNAWVQFDRRATA